MKSIFRISILANILCAGYIMIKGSELLTLDHIGKAESVKEQAAEIEKQFMEVEAAITDEKITCDTIYTVSEYDLSTERENERQESLPTSYIGMTRQQLLDWIDAYNRSISLEDLELGLQSMELVTFSETEIKVRKRIISKPENTNTAVRNFEENKRNKTSDSIYYGCILAQDGLLTIYDGDRRHVIQYTDISLFDLPQEVQQEIMDGKYITSEEELYNLLESYSS